MNIEMNETYARDTSTVWEHEIISSASDLKEWIKYEGAKYPKRTLVGWGISANGKRCYF